MPLYQPIIATSLTTITGGGTVALGGFTLTVPATGTAALLGTANIFTAAQTDKLSDSATNTSTVVHTLAHNSSGTAAASFGVGLKALLASNTTADQDASQIDTIWTTATHASRTSAFVFYTVNGAAALAESLRIAPTQLILPPISYNVATPRLTQSGQTTTGVSWSGNGLYFHISGASALAVLSGGIIANSNRVFGWAAGAPDAGGADTAIGRNAAGVAEVNNGTSGQWGAVKAGTRDAGTTTITDGLTLGHQSTGTPAAGLGIGIQLNINSTTTADQNAARLTTSWSDATHATLTSIVSLYTRTGGAAQAERLRVDAGEAGATNTGLMIWDVDNGALERVTVGAADSGGSGFKVLRIPN